MVTAGSSPVASISRVDEATRRRYQCVHLGNITSYTSRLLITYRLDVVQQPKRARMCGFGDKVCHLSIFLAVSTASTHDTVLTVR